MITYRDQLEQDSEINKVSEHQETGDNSWPPEPLTITREIRGVLADRIRNRLSVSRRKVFIEEETCYGGYSEYTQENNTSFKINCGKHNIYIHPSDSEVSWPSLGGNDSVFAKLQFWLTVGDNPESVWDNMLQFKNVAYAGTFSYDAWVVNSDSILYRLILGSYSSDRDTVHIAHLSDGNWGLAILKHYVNNDKPTRLYKSLRVPADQPIGDPEVRKLLLQRMSDSYVIQSGN